MDAFSSPSSPGKRASWLVRLARRLRYVASEVNYAEKRVSALRLSYGVAESDRSPDTYAEFLLRSATVTTPEPPARRRASGRQIK